MLVQGLPFLLTYYSLLFAFRYRPRSKRPTPFRKVFSTPSLPVCKPRLPPCLREMPILRIVPLAFILALVACGGGSFTVDGSAKSGTVVTISPSKTTLPSRGVHQFIATVGGNHDRVVSWSTTVGTVTTSGFYSAPAVTNITTVLITARTTTNSATATVTIQPTISPGPSPISVTINPAMVTLKSGASQRFTAIVSGTTNQGVTWSATNGRVTSDGQFSSPGVGVITRVYVKATSNADATHSATASVTALAQVGHHSVELSWDASTSANIVGYNVYRGPTVGGPYTKINAGGLVAPTLYTDMSVTNGTTYYYVATVVDSGGRESVHSNQAQAAIPQ